MEERRLLVKLVLSNLRVKDEKVLCDANKPFDMILGCHDRKSWRGLVDAFERGGCERGSCPSILQRALTLVGAKFELERLRSG